MTGNMIDIITHLGVAAIAGGLIGFERSYHGRPAGFRTHTLVCMASSILMLVTIYQKQWFSEEGVRRHNLSKDKQKGTSTAYYSFVLVTAGGLRACEIHQES